MKFTNEQLIQIGRDVVNEMLPHLPNGITWVNEYRGDEKAALLAAGRAAVAAVAPLLLSAPSEEECDNLERKWGKAQPDFSYSIKLLMKDRLASVLAKPDPAIEAVREVVDRHFGTWCASVEQKRTDTVLAIVAAVDAARALKP